MMSQRDDLTTSEAPVSSITSMRFTYGVKDIRYGMELSWMELQQPKTRLEIG